MHSMDIINDNVKKIAQLFPECITEVINKDNKLEKVVDFDKLKALFSSSVVEGKKERYQFTWPDKSKAMALVNQPINATLRPCREESVNFDTTENLYIEGDNLDVLKLLRETYYGKIKMIYIDPPYNTGNDFVYKDDFSQEADRYKSNSGQYDDQGNRLQKNQESNGRFHTDWLNMIYPRLKIARDLLSEEGVIFVSINDNELINMQNLCNEIFGERNFIANIIWTNKEGGGSSDSKLFRIKHEYVICFAKNINHVEIRGIEISNLERYKGKDDFYSIRGPYYLQKLGMGSIQYSASLDYSIQTPDGSYITPSQNNNGKKACWRWSKEKFLKNQSNGFVEIKKDSNNVWVVYTKQYLNCDNDGNIINRTQRPMGIIDNYSSTQAAKYIDKLFAASVFDYSKPYQLISYLIKRISSEDDIFVLDFFSGSATTADAVLRLNAEDGGKRKFIMVQLPEKCDEKREAYKAGYKNICDIGKERIRRAGKKILEEKNANSDDLFADNSNTLDVGFRVLKLDSSNMTDVYYKPEELDQDNLKNLISNIKEGRTSEDLLFQVMLDLGVLLSSNIETMDINGKTVFNVNEGYLMACFDEKVDEETVIEIAKKKPQFFVIRDLSISSDSMMVNFDQIFDRFSPETVRKVI